MRLKTETRFLTCDFDGAFGYRCGLFWRVGVYAAANDLLTGDSLGLGDVGFGLG